MSPLSRVPILLLPMSLGIGGAETHVVGLAKHLKARGWDVHVVSGGGELVKDLAGEGIEHVWAPLDSRSPLAIWRSYRTVGRIIRDRNIGLVHAHARIPAWIAEKACRSRGIPMVTTYHGTFVSGPFWNFFTRPGDLTIAVSPDVRDYTVREFGFDPARVMVIPNGIDLSIYRAATPEDRKQSRDALSVSGASPLIVYASRLDKDLTPVAESVAEAALLLKAKYPGLMLLIAGDGEGLGTLRERASAMNAGCAAETVRCLGYVTETFPVYAASDIVVGMSRVALEAMASSRPVVVAGPGGVLGPAQPSTEQELEGRNYTSRNAPVPLSPGAVAAELDALLSDASRRDALAAYGRERVSAAHSMDIVTRETEKVYASALEGTRLPRTRQ